MRKKHKVICVADVVFDFQFVLNKLVELVHIDVYQQLACEITEWQPITRGRTSWKATDDFSQEPEDILVGYISFKDEKQNLVVDGCEEFADVAFEYPSCAGVVFGYLIGKAPELVHRPVCSLTYPTGIRVGSEYSVEERVELPIYSMVEQAVAHACFVDVAGILGQRF